LEERFDVMTGLHGTRIEPVTLEEALKKNRPVDEQLLYLVDLFAERGGA
jgi:hypothetical protein